MSPSSCSAEQHLRPRDAEFEALAAHGLDQDRELQFAAPRDDIGVGIGRLLDPQRDIALGLLEQAVADDPARHLVALGSGERAVVDGEGHRQRRRVDRLRVQRLDFLRAAQRVGDVELFEPRDRDDVAGDRLVDRRALDAAEGEDLRDPARLDKIALAVEHLDRRVGPDRAGEDAAGDDAAEIGIGLEQRAEHAEAARADLRRLDMLQHEIEQRRHVLFRPVGRERHPALLGGAVEDRKVELLVGRVERGEEIEHLVDHLARPRVGLVDLVDADDGLQPDLQRLADHELGLRHRPFGGVDQHDRAVDHREDALDLAAEIGVAGRVDDIDPNVLPHDRGRLGENGDAALALEVIRIHHPLGDALVVAKCARLLQEPVDEGRLAVVDVSDDGDVAKLHDGRGLRKGAERRAGAALLYAQVTGIRRCAICEPRSAVRLCGAIHERREKGKRGVTAAAGCESRFAVRSTSKALTPRAACAAAVIAMRFIALVTPCSQFGPPAGIGERVFGRVQVSALSGGSHFGGAFAAARGRLGSNLKRNRRADENA